MQTYDEMMARARELAADGRVEEARRLAGIAQSRKETETPQEVTAEEKSIGKRLWENIVGDDDPTTQNSGEKIGSFLNKAGEAMTFGLIGDEADAAVAAVIPGGQNYDERLAHNRQQEEIFERENPAAALTAEIGGGLAGAMLPLGTIGTLSRGAGLGTRMLKSSAAGAGMGGTYGFMEGEGAADRFKDMAGGAAIGGGVGFATPAAVSGALRGLRGGRDIFMGGVDTAINRGSQGRAQRAVLEALQRSGRNVDDVSRDVQRAAREGQPEFRLMDAIGVAGQRRASGVVRSGGDGAEDLAGFLRQRQLDQPNRVAGFVDDAFTRGRTAAQTRAAMESSRDATANRAYNAARGNAAPVDVRGALAVIDDRIGGMQQSGVAGDSIDGRLAGFRQRLAAQPGPDGVSRELSDFNRVLGVKQDVQDAIGAARRAGRNNEVRELSRLQNALDAALEESSDGYRIANDGFRDASRAIDAIDEGAQMAAPSRRAQDTVRRFSEMTPDQQAAARAGYGDRALARIEANSSPTSNSAKPFTSSKVSAEADAMAVDPRLFRDRIAREQAMYGVNQRATMGSMTADNLQDIRDLSPIANVARALRDTANLQLGSAAQNLGAAVGPALSGENAATRKIIAQILMSQNPQAALRRAVESGANSAALNRVLESLTRRTGAVALQ